jgi:hypothetical protein
MLFLAVDPDEKPRAAAAMILPLS